MRARGGQPEEGWRKFCVGRGAFTTCKALASSELQTRLKPRVDNREAEEDPPG